MVWYHGTPQVFEKFSSEFIGQGNDQLGSGFYFTDDYDTALGYALKSSDGQSAPGVMLVELNISKPLPEEGGLTATHVEQILKSAPEFLDLLENFGDVSFDGETKVLRTAVQTYLSISDADTLQALNSISNDFYRGSEALFLRNVAEASGYNGLIRKVGEQNHAVAWLPEQVLILERRAVSSPAPGL